MTDQPLKDLSPDQAHDILKGYAQRNFGAGVEVSTVSFREDYRVWEAWVSGVEGYVKAYIVRLGASNGEWVCRHITVMDSAPGPRRGED
jgi:hypothetical protein